MEDLAPILPKHSHPRSKRVVFYELVTLFHSSSLLSCVAKALYIPEKSGISVPRTICSDTIQLFAFQDSGQLAITTLGSQSLCFLTLFSATFKQYCPLP